MWPSPYVQMRGYYPVRQRSAPPDVRLPCPVLGAGRRGGDGK